MAQLSDGICLTSSGADTLFFFEDDIAFCKAWNDTFKNIYQPQIVNGQKFQEVEKYYYDEKDFKNFSVRNIEYGKAPTSSVITLRLVVDDRYSSDGVTTKFFVTTDVKQLGTIEQLIAYISPKTEKYIEYLKNAQVEDRATQAMWALPFYEKNPNHDFKSATFREWEQDKGLTRAKDVHPKAREFNNKMKYLYEYINKHPELNVIAFDTETTGVDVKKDYVLSLGIINYHGEVLFDEMFKPGRKTSWTDASVKNGIWYSDVADKKLISEYKEEIQKIFNTADIVIGYNHNDFDIPMLNNEKNKTGIKIKDTVASIDVMKIASSMIGASSTRYYDYQFVKLTDAYEHFIGGEYKAHNSIEDARAIIGDVYTQNQKWRTLTF